MAGDIKYRNSCLWNFFDKQTIEIKFPWKLRSHCSEVQETYECTIVTDENVSCLDVSHSNWPQFELRNGQTIMLKTYCSTDGPDSSLKEVILAEIIEGLKIELSAGQVITMNNLVEIYRTRWWNMEWLIHEQIKHCTSSSSI